MKSRSGIHFKGIYFATTFTPDLFLHNMFHPHGPSTTGASDSSCHIHVKGGSRAGIMQLAAYSQSECD